MGGVNCPRCDSSTRTLETRRAPDGAAVRRRRVCSSCGHRFTTYERAVAESLEVLKRDGKRQPFDRAKLLSALIGASHKRDIDPRRLEAIVDGIERVGREVGGELTAERIAELCLDGLRDLDHGAYLQFAGTLPDPSGNPRKDGQSGLPSSVRSAEDADLPPAESNREEND
jgi:transcriptional repressor NrdR